MAKRDEVVALVERIVQSKATAEIVVEVLETEGFIHIGYGDADVDRVVKKFTDTFGTTKVSRQDRFAANRLVRKHGAQALVGIIDLLAEFSGGSYAPTVGSVVQLEEKWVSVIRYLAKQKEREELDI